LTPPSTQHQHPPTATGTGRKWEHFSEFDLHAPKSTPPPLPTSPMPQSPPVAAMQPPPLAPRKSQARPGASSNVDIMHVLSSNGPDVGRRLENLRLTELEDIFDQEFDPRAGEPQLAGHHNPFENVGKSVNGENGKKETNEGATSSMGEPSSEDFEMAISMIDSRLADMRDGFSSGISFGKDDFHMADFDPFQHPGNSAAAAGIGDLSRKTN